LTAPSAPDQTLVVTTYAGGRACSIPFHSHPAWAGGTAGKALYRRSHPSGKEAVMRKGTVIAVLLTLVVLAAVATGIVRRLDIDALRERELDDWAESASR
tara:strand:- start:5115 stop:5414 length:300 start_codon:yes stop_codon:yes gene_type:complete